MIIWVCDHCGQIKYSDVGEGIASTFLTPSCTDKRWICKKCSNPTVRYIYKETITEKLSNPYHPLSRYVARPILMAIFIHPLFGLAGYLLSRAEEKNK